MSTLLDQFKVADPNWKQKVAAAKPPRNTLFTYLEAEQTFMFEPAQRFKLTSQGTLCFVFHPNWAPWSDPADPGSKKSPPCLIQYGSETEPASGFRVCVTRELDQLLLFAGKSEHPVAAVPGKFSDGAYVAVSINKKTTLWAKGGAEAPHNETYSFKLGDLNGTPTLTLGGGEGETLFEGAIGNILLFDHDIWPAALKSEKGPVGRLLGRWMDFDPQGIFDLYSQGSADSDVLSLVGIGFPGEAEPRFDFIPSEIMRPTRPLARWTLEDGDNKPLPVSFEGFKDENHAVHTTNNIFCFLRIAAKELSPGHTEPGGVYLWGDQGHRFVISYSGKNTFSGVADSAYYGGKWSGYKITLTYTPQPHIPHEPGRMAADCVGWDNGTERIFANRVSPPGATIKNLDADVHWPSKIAFKRIPADYRIIADLKNEKTGEGMAEQWGSAFTESGCNILASMQGWDISKLNNPLNIGNSTAAIGTDYVKATLAPPPADSKFYRSENGSFLPYYCSCTNLDTTYEPTTTTAYSTVREVSQETAKSGQFGLDVAGKSVLDCSFNKLRKEGSEASEDHAITIHSSTTLSHATLLQKQWLQLNPDFLRALRNANAQQPSDLYNVFNTWGTHYPHAVVYGWGYYSIAFIDEAGAAQLVETKDSEKASVAIPIENSLLKLSTTFEQDDKTQNREKVKTQVETKKEIGSPERLVVMRIDLRPISELIQPPYVTEDDLPYAYTAQAFVQTALEQYLASRPKLVPEGNVLYQAKLLKIENLSDKPLYFNARAFMVGVKKGENDESMIYVPREVADRNDLKPIWRDSVRLEPKGDDLKATHIPKASFTDLTISRGDSSIVPQIRITGVCNSMLKDGIRDVLTYWYESTPTTTTESVLQGLFGGDPGGGPPRTVPQKTYPSKEQIKTKEESLGALEMDHIDKLGTDWYSSDGLPIYEPNLDGDLTQESVPYELKHQVTFPNLSGKGEIQEVAVEVPASSV